MIAYHDEEWGRPIHDDSKLFELLILEGAQAGLSWRTILAKREAYRRAFARFDPRKVATFTGRDVARLLRDPGIVRNRLKIASAIRNARALLALQRECGSFDAFAWRFVGGAPIDKRRRTRSSLPARTRESDAFSDALIRAGFTFVGSTICYAFMQSVGMVNDHLMSCDFRRPRPPRSPRARRAR